MIFIKSADNLALFYPNVNHHITHHTHMFSFPTICNTNINKTRSYVNPMIRLKVDSGIKLSPAPRSYKAYPTKMSPTLTGTLKHPRSPFCRGT